jgi:hypothetical protein
MCSDAEVEVVEVVDVRLARAFDRETGGGRLSPAVEYPLDAMSPIDPSSPQRLADTARGCDAGSGRVKNRMDLL